MQEFAELTEIAGQQCLCHLVGHFVQAAHSLQRFPATLLEKAYLLVNQPEPGANLARVAKQQMCFKIV